MSAPVVFTLRNIGTGARAHRCLFSVRPQLARLARPARQATKPLPASALVARRLMSTKAESKAESTAEAAPAPLFSLSEWPWSLPNMGFNSCPPGHQMVIERLQKFDRIVVAVALEVKVTQTPQERAVYFIGGYS